MILHMGGVFGDKEATLDRFRQNHRLLSSDVKKRLVLENDDVSWSVHDLLPICQELNIPLVLDYHHHNIIFSDEVREGTLDIMSLYEDIKRTWTRKGITQKMHYSEPTASAITDRQRRKHSARVMTLPPCASDMDLMIEAKDKEQAVFELMRTFKLPGWDKFSNLVPHVRVDENVPAKKPRKKATLKKKPAKGFTGKEDDGIEAAEYCNLPEEDTSAPIPEEEVGMGGPEGRVYWPPGMEEWLRPAKRAVKKKSTDEGLEQLSTAKKRRVAIKHTAEAAVIASVVRKQSKSTPAKSTNGKKKGTAKAFKASKDVDEESSEELPDLSGASDFVRSEKPAVTQLRHSKRAKKVDYTESNHLE